MSHNTFGHLFRVTTFGESHGVALGCVVDGCPPRIPLTAADIQPWLDKRRPGQSRFTTQRREPDTVKILSGTFADESGAAGHDRHADRAADRECRPALEGLFGDQGHIPARPRRLHLRCEIRHPRLSRRRARVGARDGGAGRGRRDRPQDRARHDRARRAGADRPAQHRPRALGLGEVDRNPFFCPDAGAVATFERIPRRRPQAGLLGRRRDRGGGRGRAAGPGRAGLRQARCRSRRRADEHQRRQGRRDRRRLCGRRAVRRGECRRDAHGQRRQAALPRPTMPAASSAASRPASRSSRASP